MAVILFILVLVALILVHEFGHLVAAKLFHMRVDEFGIGYPPRAATLFTKGGTEYTLNWLPFGGFVKIFGEDSEDRGEGAFASKPKWQQAIVLIAGITMNLVFAWLLVSASLMSGLPQPISSPEAAHNPHARLIVSNVVPSSPAASADILNGDTILETKAGEENYTGAVPEEFVSFVEAHQKENLQVSVLHNGTMRTVSLTPKAGLVPSDPARAVLGVGVASYDVSPVPPVQALLRGFELTLSLTKEVALGLIHFFVGIFTLSANLSEVSGPVGIAGAVGSASALGLPALLSLIAIISINLALVNLIPVPALDGGRLLFVAIEAIIRKPLPGNIAGAVNAVGFSLLILLMLVVTAHDILKLVH